MLISLRLRQSFLCTHINYISMIFLERQTNRSNFLRLQIKQKTYVDTQLVIEASSVCLKCSLMHSTRLLQHSSMRNDIVDRSAFFAKQHSSIAIDEIRVLTFKLYPSLISKSDKLHAHQGLSISHYAALLPRIIECQWT